LLVQIQDKDGTITSLKTENDNLSSALNAAESRLSELYADQGRMEEEMAARIEVIEKLRNQVRELEKEKRDTQRRYNEQTSTFEAERQAFYDNEQHLKSRIQSLSQARKIPPPVIPPSPSMISVAESDVTVDEGEMPDTPLQGKQDVTDPEQEPAEMTALKLELTTLSTSHASIQSTLHLLQTQLVDLKRVNHELQEENESYNILLREKTLSGQFDVLRMGGAITADASETSSATDDAGEEGIPDAGSIGSRHTSRSRLTLDPVDELAEEQQEESQEPLPELDPEFGQIDESERSPVESDASRNARNRHARKRSLSTAPRGESLANLPITGPGLDLAAELGRAENKDILDGHISLDDRATSSKPRHDKKGAHKSSSTPDGGANAPTSLIDIDALRSEVKSLKDANKALSLYASKIIDRIISQEGFEHVLAADYEKPPPTPASPAFHMQPASPPSNKTRPHSAMFSRSPSASATTPVLPAPERLTTFDSLNASPQSNASASSSPSARTSRRSLSFDWKSFSIFGGGEKKPEPPANLRPLTLKVARPVSAADRKLETYEDEEDRRERERLNATMKLMGIEKPEPPTSPLPPMLRSVSTPGYPNGDTSDLPPLSATSASTPGTAPTPTARFSFFRRSNSMVNRSETSSVGSSIQGSPHLEAASPSLTQEALEQAEAESSLAALDAHERQLSAEMAKGSGGGFTEIVRRNGDRRSSRRSASGSGSTVWSAGMSKYEDDE
ncbi:hypothetical protein EW026_g6621, partial [Hermanssonia centrifuga]